jgi:hypothetical protein
VASNQLHIINEERHLTTFQNSRGERNIDLIIANNKMLPNIQDWDISEEESASDHNFIKFNINSDNAEVIVPSESEQRLRIKEHQHTKFFEKFQHIAAVMFQIKDRALREEELDEVMSQSIEETSDIRESTKKLEKAIKKRAKK